MFGARNMWFFEQENGSISFINDLKVYTYYFLASLANDVVCKSHLAIPMAILS